MEKGTCAGPGADNKVVFEHDRVGLAEPPDTSAMEGASRFELDGTSSWVVGVPGRVLVSGCKE